MKFKDKIKIAFKFFAHSKKKIIYSIILLICTFSLLITLIVNSYLESLFTVGKFSIMSRSFQVFDSNRYEEDSKELASELKEINHVIDAYPFEYENAGLEFMFTSNEKAWTIATFRRTSESLPKVKYGRKYSNDETNVMVCGEKFSDYETGYEHINSKEFLNKEIEVSYYDIKFDLLGKPLFQKENELHTEKFKIIGIVENKNSFPNYTDCYLPPKEIDRLYDIKQGKYDEDFVKFRNENEKYLPLSSNVIIVVDKNSNMDEVKSEIEKLGYEVEPRIILDREMFKTFYMIAGIIILISIFTILVITLSYAKKKLTSEKKNIKVMQIEGMTRKDIGSIYAIETFVNNSIIFVLVSIITVLVQTYLVNNVYEVYLYIVVMLSSSINISGYIITFIIMVLCPSILVYLKVKSKKNNLNKLLASK